jgi:hypothetical protein
MPLEREEGWCEGQLRPNPHSTVGAGSWFGSSDLLTDHDTQDRVYLHYVRVWQLNSGRPISVDLTYGVLHKVRLAHIKSKRGDQYSPVINKKDSEHNAHWRA